MKYMTNKLADEPVCVCVCVRKAEQLQQTRSNSR